MFQVGVLVEPVLPGGCLRALNSPPHEFVPDPVGLPIGLGTTPAGPGTRVAVAASQRRRPPLQVEYVPGGRLVAGEVNRVSPAGFRPPPRQKKKKKAGQRRINLRQAGRGDKRHHKLP